MKLTSNQALRLVCFSVAITLLAPAVYAHNPLKSSDKAMTNSPLDKNTCGSCHNATSTVNQSPNATLTGISGTTYTPGTAYTLTLSLTTSSSGKNGFEITSENATAKAGTFSVGSATDVQLVSNSSWLGHRTAKTGSASWSFTWTAPVAGSGKVCFYLDAMVQSSSQKGPEWFNSFCYTEAASSPPIITTQPTNQTANVGQTVTVRVTATGSGLTYQWQGAPPGSTVFVNVAGATAASYTSPAVTAAESGTTSRVIVTNSGGSVTSNVVTLTVNVVAPAITAQPVNQSVAVNQTATFSVAASGSAPFTYQWQKAPSGSSTFSAITGATSASYTTPATVQADSGSQYHCVVTNSAGSATSNAATLTVTVTPPAVTSQPANQSILVGQTATFSISASGSSPLSYQWQMTPSGSSIFSPIAGATSASYTTTAAVLTDSGSKYQCVITNSAGSVTSNATLLTVAASATPPSITTQPLPQTVAASQTATFTVAASGTAPLLYQWQKAPSGSATFTSISGATSASYSTPATATSDNGSSFRCVVTNGQGNATSNSAILTVNAAAPLITLQPAAQSVAAGQTATFSATASGTAPLLYQWQKAPSGSATFTSMAGATSASYTTPTTTIADNGASFRVVVTNSAGTVTSAAATLTVAVIPPTVTTDPADQTVTASQKATFSVAAAGSTPLSYQWQKAAPGSGTFSNISGATSASYSTPVTTLADSGSNFQCVVTNSAGSVTSLPATLTVSAAAAPDITVQPVDTSVWVGQPVTFSVTVADHADPTLTYTWYRDGVVIPATNNGKPTYTLPATTTADNGAQFYVICENAGGPNISDTVNLFVTQSLATPQIGNLKPYMSLKDTLQVVTTYGVPVSFYWTFTKTAAVAGFNAPGSTVLSNLTTVSAKTSSYSSALNVASLGLAPGQYQMSVTASDSNGDLSPAMTANVAFLTSDLSNPWIYPNPWRSDRYTNRVVHFKRLTVNSTVKIFTVSGHLVKTLDGSTGAADWLLDNDSGDQVASGIYLYLITDSAGQKARGQIVVIH